jgi:TolA-binding protein
MKLYLRLLSFFLVVLLFGMNAAATTRIAKLNPIRTIKAEATVEDIINVDKQLTPISNVNITFTSSESAIAREAIEQRIAQLEEQQRIAEQQRLEQIRIAQAAENARLRQIEQDRLVQVAREKAAAVRSSSANTVQAAPAATGNGSSWEARIGYWCGVYGCNTTQLIRVMYCESGGRTNAKNPSGPYSGLFQFHPNTFAANAARVGISGANIWNGEHQVQTASWMFANGQASQWECK